MVSADVLRGYTETVILRKLLEGDTYGYEISHMISEISGGEIDIKDATIYIAFRRMEESGLITAYWGNDETGGARRRYYSITEKGKQYYIDKSSEWLKINKILMKLIIGDEQKWVWTTDLRNI